MAQVECVSATEMDKSYTKSHESLSLHIELRASAAVGSGSLQVSYRAFSHSILRGEQFILGINQSV